MEEGIGNKTVMEKMTGITNVTGSDKDFKGEEASER